MKKLILIAASAVSFHGLTFADNSPHPLEISGLGAESCASYVLALNENRPTAGITWEGKTYLTEAGAYTQWVVGFFNAISWVRSSTDTLRDGKKFKFRPLPSDVNAIALSVKKICEAKPDWVVASAVIHYANGDRN